MRMIFQVLLFVCILAGFAACQKEIEGTLPARTQSDSTDLTRLIVLDTTLTPGQDTLYKVEFFYDAQKRRVLEIFTEIDNSSGTRYTWFYRYYHLNNDTLPYRITEKNAITADSISYYLSYTNGFITKDSAVDHHPAALSSRVYYYSAIPGNRYLEKGIDYDIATNSPMVVDSTIYIRSVVAGNTISGRDSIWIVPSPPMLSRVYSMQFAFDNKPNPLAKLSLWYLGHYNTFDNQMYGTRGINNITSAGYTDIFPNSSFEVYNYSYTYLNNGYPSVIRINSTDGNKIVFVYTKL